MFEDDVVDQVNSLLFLRNKSILSVGEKKRKPEKVEGIINFPNPHVIVQEVLNMQSIFDHVRQLKRIIDVLKCMESKPCEIWSHISEKLRNVQYHLKEFQSGNLIRQTWNERGPIPLLSENDIDSIQGKIKKSAGQAHDTGDMKAIIQEVVDENMEKRD
eukprot:8715566-Ditylum_brightwellii.AAC.1